MNTLSKLLALLFEKEKAVEQVYSLDPSKESMAEKPLSVASERASEDKTGNWWDEVYDWRARDFKGSLVQWLRDNGPKSKLIPVTYDLYGSLSRGVFKPYWNRNIKFNFKGISLQILDKKYFFRWEDLVFQVRYDLYDYHTVEVAEGNITFMPATIYLYANDGTEIGWVPDVDTGLFGNLEVDLVLPKKIVSRGEEYVFPYQDGLSGYFGQTIPVWYFASDLAKKIKEERKVAK